MKTELAKALAELEITRAEASRATGIDYGLLHRHCSGERTISIKSAFTYEQALGIPRGRLRPDIWPWPKDKK